MVLVFVMMATGLLIMKERLVINKTYHHSDSILKTNFWNHPVF